MQCTSSNTSYSPTIQLAPFSTSSAVRRRNTKIETLTTTNTMPRKSLLLGRTKVVPTKKATFENFCWYYTYPPYSIFVRCIWKRKAENAHTYTHCNYVSQFEENIEDVKGRRAHSAINDFWIPGLKHGLHCFAVSFLKLDSNIFLFNECIGFLGVSIAEFLISNLEYSSISH